MSARRSKRIAFSAPRSLPCSSPYGQKAIKLLAVRGIEAASTQEWVAWHNHYRLMEPLDYIPPAEPWENYYRQIKNDAEVSSLA
ncbi:hypothetical protein E9536_40570 [Burkholderia sp. LS-044]|nr:hypothetical protein E9536_40570 [Burkholderia sp. LS-044]